MDSGGIFFVQEKLPNVLPCQLSFKWCNKEEKGKNCNRSIYTVLFHCMINKKICANFKREELFRMTDGTTEVVNGVHLDVTDHWREEKWAGGKMILIE